MLSYLLPFSLLFPLSLPSLTPWIHSIYSFVTHPPSHSFLGDILNMSAEGRGSPALSVASSSGYRSYNQELPGGGAGDGYRLPPPRESPFQPPQTSMIDPRGTSATPSSSAAYGINSSYDDLRNTVDTLGGYGSARATPVNR